MQDVTIDRNIYVGGSDLPILMDGKSFDTSNVDLVKEKAGIKKRDFVSNKYIEYGNNMEEKIRTAISTKLNVDFIEEKFTDENLHIRGHLDGYGKIQQDNIVLEIKTTSETDLNKKIVKYNYQIQMYMYLSGAKKGIIAIYKRPKDFSEEYTNDNLELHEIEYDQELVSKMLDKIKNFWIAVNELKELPFLSDTEIYELLNNSDYNIVEVSNELEQIEIQLHIYDKIIKEYKKEKEKLLQVFVDNDIKTFETTNGTKITLTKASETTKQEIVKLDTIKEQKYLNYLKRNDLIETKTTKRKASLRVTLPKENK